MEREHGLPCPTLGSQSAKTSPEARKSWMITGLTAAPEPAGVPGRARLPSRGIAGRPVRGDRLELVEHVAGKLWAEPEELPGRDRLAEGSRRPGPARGLKLGIHVMTRSITKRRLGDPRPDPRLLTEGEVTLAADIDAAAQEIPTVESPANFGTSSGYWAYRGTDVLIDEEIVRYQALNTQSPFALTKGTRGLRDQSRRTCRRCESPAHH